MPTLGFVKKLFSIGIKCLKKKEDKKGAATKTFG